MNVAPILPTEILSLILSYLPPSSQSTLYSAALVSRAWYSSAIRDLYYAPIVNGSKFDLFVRAVCPSINAHVRHNGLACFIRKLDLSRLIHNSSKSLTARLLGRVKNNVEEFIAPQASFGINCLAALSKCNRLQSLNLKWVSEGIALYDLLRSIQGLDKLVTLQLPRAASHATSIHHGSEKIPDWPKNLQKLHFNGNFIENNSDFLNAIPPSTSALYFEQSSCPDYRTFGNFFEKKGSQLHTLRLNIGEQHEDWMYLRMLEQHCVNLKHLSINLALLISNWRHLFQNQYPFLSLEVLEIDRSVYVDDSNLDWHLQALLDILFDTNTMPLKLRKLQLHEKLKWTQSKTRLKMLGDIDSLFKALAREDGKGAWISEEEAGVSFLGV